MRINITLAILALIFIAAGPTTKPTLRNDAFLLARELWERKEEIRKEQIASLQQVMKEQQRDLERAKKAKDRKHIQTVAHKIKKTQQDIQDTKQAIWAIPYANYDTFKVGFVGRFGEIHRFNGRLTYGDNLTVHQVIETTKTPKPVIAKVQFATGIRSNGAPKLEYVAIWLDGYNTEALADNMKFDIDNHTIMIFDTITSPYDQNTYLKARIVDLNDYLQ